MISSIARQVDGNVYIVPGNSSLNVRLSMEPGSAGGIFYVAV